MRAEIGRQDRPRHVGEAAGKERRGQLDDVMLRLEPGDVMRVCSRPTSRKRTKACILCSSRRTALAIAVTSATSGSVATDMQIGMTAQPPQQPVQDRKALDIAMQDRRLRQFDEFCGNVEAGVRPCRFGRQRFGLRREQFRLVVLARARSHRPASRHSARAFRAAVRQPSKSVSLSSVMKCMILTLSTFVMAGLCPGHPRLCSKQGSRRCPAQGRA